MHPLRQLDAQESTPAEGHGSAHASVPTARPHPRRAWTCRRGPVAGTRLAMALLVLLTGLGCGRRGEDGAQQTASTPEASELAPLELRDGTPNLLLTWVDAKGDFHVVQKTTDVPEAGRERVRVVQTTREEGTGRLVYVADLRAKAANGTYPVKTMTRAQWDEIGAQRREQRLEALAPSASTSAAPPHPATPGEFAVVIYGAEWCKPCHDAERYLKRRGTPVTLKDIEKNQLARAELQQKLKQANLPGTAQIPIIDVGGQLLVGFSPSAIDRALKRAEGAETL